MSLTILQVIIKHIITPCRYLLQIDQGFPQGDNRFGVFEFLVGDAKIWLIVGDELQITSENEHFHKQTYIISIVLDV
jgi:hypothetical protein